MTYRGFGLIAFFSICLLGTAIAALAYTGPRLVEQIANPELRRAVFAASQASLEIEQQLKETSAAVLQSAAATAEAGSKELSQNLLQYNRVSVSGNQKLATESILKVSGLAAEPYFWDHSAADVKRRIDALGWVKSSSVIWQLFPLGLTVQLEEHAPWLVAEYEGHTWVLSKALTLVAPLQSIDSPDLVMELSELPRLAGLQPAENVPSYLASSNARLRHAAHTIALLDTVELPFPVERYDLLDDGSLRMTPRDSREFPQILVALATDEDAQLFSKRLHAVLQDLRIRREVPQEIDLRFRNQAVIR